MGGSGSWFKSLIRKQSTNNQVRKYLFVYFIYQAPTCLSGVRHMSHDSYTCNYILSIHFLKLVSCPRVMLGVTVLYMKHEYHVDTDNNLKLVTND